MTSIRIKAPAKLNLGLEILGRRDDGYHEIRTVLQTISIHDRLDLTPAPTFDLSCSKSDLAGDGNLALSAVLLLANRLNVETGVLVSLKKEIPTAAGLGGASSDAAAALRAAAHLWQIHFSDRDLEQLGSELGSDVPFFIQGGTALAAGRGEDLTPLRPLNGGWFVVVTPTPMMTNKTATMYRLLQPQDFTDGAIVAATAAAIGSGQLPDWQILINTFARAATAAQPELIDLGSAFRAAGAPFVALTGAGPSLFTHVDDPDHARTIQSGLLARLRGGVETFVCEPLPCSPPPVAGQD